MIRYRYLLLVAFLFSGGLLQHASAYSELWEVRVTGGITSRTKYHFSYKNRILDTNSKKKTETILFDKKGTMTMKMQHDSVGAVEAIEIIDYRENPTESRHTSPDMMTKLKRLTIYRYNKLEKYGERMEVEYNAAGEVHNRFRLRSYQNNNGQIIRELESHAYTTTNDSFDVRSTSAYNANGRLIERISYSPDGSVYSKEILRYDAGLLTETIEFTKEKYHSKRIYGYDKRRNLVSEMEYNSQDSVVEKITYIHKKNKKITEIEYLQRHNIHENNDIDSYHQYISRYDSKGHILEWSDCDSSGIVRQKHLWKYDQKGNKIAFQCICYPMYNLCCTASPTQEWKYDRYSNCSEEITYDASNKPLYKTEFFYTK